MDTIERRQKLREALRCVREAVWGMERGEDIERVLEAVGTGLAAVGVPYNYCGVNVVEAKADPPTVTMFTMKRGEGAWRMWQSIDGGIVVEFWRRQQVVYRSDLHRDDPYGEFRPMSAIRSVADVPFSHGTLAVSSVEPDVLSAEDLEILQDMAEVLSEGFHRQEDLQALERRNRDLEAEVAERRQVQAQLQQSLSQLEAAHRDLRQTQTQLVQSVKMAALGDLVAGIAHELNTPVGSINSVVNTLDRALKRLEASFEGQEGKQVRGALAALDSASRVIGDGARRVDQIVRSLRNFARLDEREFKVADIHEGLDSTLILLGSQLGPKVEIVKSYGDVTPIYCAPGQLNQVFMHLLRHGANTMDGAGRICIETAQANGWVTVRIADSGAGMPASERERLFEIGFEMGGQRVETGFSWAADWAIVRDHGGQIQVESEVGQGTAVTISLAGADG